MGKKPKKVWIVDELVFGRDLGALRSAISGGLDVNKHDREGRPKLVNAVIDDMPDFVACMPDAGRTSMLRTVAGGRRCASPPLSSAST